MHLTEITDGIYAIGGLKTGRAYLIEDAAGLTLVDTSTASASEGILSAIGELGRQPEDLRTIVATHYHHDHIGNAATLVARTGAALCAHEAEVEYIEGRTPWLMPKLPVIGGMMANSAPEQSSIAVKVARVVRDGDMIDAAGGLQVVHAPGHTPGHIALLTAERSTLFAGDAFFNSLGLHPPIAAVSHDMEQAKASIRRLSDLTFEYALPGHGAPVLSRASEKLAEWSRRWL
jgi:glyoxylase-like metal-dependent hydrolase (beta-lactamase superfamily II)